MARFFFLSFYLSQYLQRFAVDDVTIDGLQRLCVSAYDMILVA
jgi:hypothetical protein